ncbi:MAG: hypothetical protein RL115_2529 [Bacteroidota bacterium]|jgi:hypothetical protein
MKFFYTICLICICSIAVQAQPATHEGHNHGATPDTVPVKTAQEDVLSLKENSFDFGKISQGKPVYHTFIIINNGKTPLILDNVQASCGCTTPEWSREPIAVGAKGEIKVGYNAAAEGPFSKPVTLTYNGTQSKQITITGTVWKAPEGPAPTNAATNLLKKQTFN